MTPVLLFEGAELSGKSFIISQIYNYLEPQYHSGSYRLDGCHWFNSDIGIYGGPHARLLIEKYTDIAEKIKDKPIIFEKFHISDMAYQKIYQNKEVQYNDIEGRLKKRQAKLLFLYIKEDESLFAHRLKDRLKLYPHYRSIAQEPIDYIKQQRVYKYLIRQSSLPTLEIDSSQLPNKAIVKDIINWLQ